MRLSSTRCTLALPLLAFTACAAPERVTIADELFPGAVAKDRGPYLTRILDDFTGEPVAGAEVFLVEESKAPMAGEFWFSHRGVSDAEGFVRIARPNGDRDWHLQVLRHPKYGTVSRSGHWAPPWRLGAAFNVPVVIKDWLGQPAPGAHIGFCGGCGHSPDLVNAVADANGVAVLAGIDPHNDIADLYVQHPGLHFFYNSVRWLPGEAAMEVRCGLAPAQTGKVVDHRGQPVAGVSVRSGDQHRGPWARTAADGTFTVLGANPGHTPHMVRMPDGRQIYFPSARGYPVTMQLPDLSDAEVYQGTIDGPQASEPAARPTKVLRVQVENAKAATLRLFVRYEGQPASAPAEPEAVQVPLTGAFILGVVDTSRGDSSSREFVFADASLVPDPLVVRWTDDVRVRGQVVDPRGQPRAARVRLRTRWSEDEQREEGEWVFGADGRFELPTESAGMRLLEVEDDAQALRSRLLWVQVPRRGSAETVEVGNVALESPHPLRVVGADGAPLRKAHGAFARPGWQQVGQYQEWALGSDGAWRGPDLRSGDVVFVQQNEQSLPFRTLLRGEGPWCITVPAGQLDLTVVGSDGEPLDAVVVFEDQWIEATGGGAGLRGLPCGAQRLFVSAPGHRSAVVDTLVATAQKALRVQLPRR